MRDAEAATLVLEFDMSEVTCKPVADVRIAEPLTRSPGASMFTALVATMFEDAPRMIPVPGAIVILPGPNGLLVTGNGPLGWRRTWTSSTALYMLDAG